MPVTQEGFSPEALEANLAQLAANEYPGRLIVQGLTAVDGLVQAYAIMGRSEGSRNRVFEHFDDGGSIGVRTAPHVVKEGEDHSLTIYSAMRAAEFGIHVATNGEQTDALIDAIREELHEGNDPEYAFLNELQNWGYEPDKPNWTPRINAFLNTNNTRNRGFSIMAYMSKSPDGFRIDRTVHQAALDQPGVGYALHTYDTDGDPLPSFTGEPYAIPLGATVKETAERLWDALDDDNKVSLAVKRVSRAVGQNSIILKNKHLGD